MGDRIGGWGIAGSSAAGAASSLEKPGQAAGSTKRQHVVTGLSVSFSGTPSSPVLVQLVDPDVSSNAVYFSRYVLQGFDREFGAGICIPLGLGVTLQVGAGGGSLVATASLDGYTR